MRVYLDTCCLNRPFDDQTQPRIRAESEAVRQILTGIEKQSSEWVASDILHYELDSIEDLDRRSKIRHWLALVSSTVLLDETIVKRAERLQAFGLHRYDALHIACAEAGGADIFVTTDDRLLRAALRLRHKLRLAIVNPTEWQTGEEG